MHLHAPHRAPAFVLVAALFSACGATAPGDDGSASRVVLYRNGVGYFERDADVRDGELRLAVRNHELDDVLSTLAIVSGDEGADIVPVAALPPPRGEEDDPDEVHRLRFAVGEGATRVRVAWATQTPAWRVSYRLVLPAGDERGRGHLSGWAVVDNTTAEDWRGVRLTLATAEPLSFAVDLRTPRYVDRPDVTGYVAPRIAAGPVFSERMARSVTADRDSDGILDVDDQCPDDSEQYNGMEDSDGCPDVGAVLIESNALTILEAIYFEEGSSAIRATSVPILEAVAATLRGNPQIDAEIHGHADQSEDQSYRLAAERAGNVRQALVDLGVDPSRLSVRGFGATRLIDPRNTREAHARNRRVTFSVDQEREGRGSEGGIGVEAMARASRRSSTPRTGIGGTRYTIERRIDVPAGRSALVSAVSVPVVAEEVYLFRPDPEVRASVAHPFRAARVENDADVDLVPGPVALYGHGRLLGQGMLEGLRAGEDVIIPWALDDGTKVERSSSEETTPLSIVSVSHSRVVLRSVRTRRVVYDVDVGRHAPRRMLIRHVLHPGAELDSPPPGTEHGEQGVVLVPLPIASRESSTLTLVERWNVDDSLDLHTDVSIDLRPFVAGTTLAEADRARFEEIMGDRAALRQSDARAVALGRRLDEHGVRSAELRSALEALPDGASIAAVRRRLARQLLAAVTDGEAISAELAELRAREVEARGRLRAVSAGFAWPAPSIPQVAARDQRGE